MSSAVKIQPEDNKTYRLVTRSDMDGLVCGILLKALGLIHDVMFAHPKDMQDGKIAITAADMTANLPYVPGAYLSFDHHASEVERVGGLHANHVIDDKAASAARVIFDYFGGRANPKFAGITDDMMSAVDKADAAKFTREEILDPSGWVLLSFIMDARTGLGRFRDFGISNYDLMMNLINHIGEYKSVEDILALPDVKERVDLYFLHQQKSRQQIERCSTIHKNLILLDLRRESQIWAGNRFVIYALFPQCNISMHALWGKNQQNTVFAVGKSILNRTSNTHVGKLMLEFGGGGHEAAGTCQIDNDEAETVKKTLIVKINKDG